MNWWVVFAVVIVLQWLLFLVPVGQEQTCIELFFEKENLNQKKYIIKKDANNETVYVAAIYRRWYDAELSYGFVNESVNGSVCIWHPKYILLNEWE